MKPIKDVNLRNLWDDIEDDYTAAQMELDSIIKELGRKKVWIKRAIVKIDRMR